jgi:hypothetical protein
VSFLLIEQPLKAATPETADLGLVVHVSRPAGLPLPGVMDSVIVALLPVTVLLLASRTVTVTAGAMLTL